MKLTPKRGRKPKWGIRPHSVGQWLAHLGISDKAYDKLVADAAKRLKR